MKIEIIQLSPSVTTTLADDSSSREGARDLKKQVIRRQQQVEAIGAAELDQHDRGNQRTTITFTVRRQHATIAAAVLAWIDSDAPMDLKGHLKITEGATTRYLPKCIVTAIADQPQGVSTITTYTCTGGKLTATAPT